MTSTVSTSRWGCRDCWRGSAPRTAPANQRTACSPLGWGPSIILRYGDQGDPRWRYPHHLWHRCYGPALRDAIQWSWFRHIFQEDSDSHDRQGYYQAGGRDWDLVRWSLWCEASGEMTKTGQYLSVWVLESELYVALGGMLDCTVALYIIAIVRMMSMMER